MHRPPELQQVWEFARQDIEDRNGKCWAAEDWLIQLEQTQRNVLVFVYKDFRALVVKNKTKKAPGIAHANIEEVGRRLIRGVDGVRTLLPPGFVKVEPRITADQSLAMLVDLMGDQGKPTCQRMWKR